MTKGTFTANLPVNDESSFFAHSGLQADLSDWQPLHQHLTQVAQLAAERAQVFKASDWAHLMGLLHDLGKYSQEFQARIRGSNQRTDHATAGAQVVMQHFVGLYGDRNEVKAFAKIFAFAIAGHHAGLANGDGEGHERSTLKQRLSVTTPSLDAVWKQEITLPNVLSMPALKAHARPEKYANFRWAFFTRMLFSCLIDADRIDTENYTRRINRQKPLSTDHPSISILQDQLNQHLNQLAQNTKDTSPVNPLRQHILAYARQQAAKSPGLFSLTVPTGGGKTLTSLAFGLDHAVQHKGMRRVIYVIPFTSIIEQTAQVFRAALGEHKDAVLEHHSAFDRDKLPEEIRNQGKPGQADYRDKLRLTMESWDAPIVVTTAVQFFESLFSDRPSQCRKLHNIAGSVIVLDEAQTLPLKLLRPIMAAIDELALNYGCSVVLCTATQPALKDGDFHNGFENVREIAPNPSELFEKLRRTQVKSLGEQSDEELTAHLRHHPQVLMIVNNRRHARELFESIAKEEGAYHLTTSMCAEHRSQKLDEIRERLKAGLPCRLVATSLIEAGVDVDFPTVYRAEAGLDSIAQAAGRCNREGRRALEDSQVFVFQSPEWKAPPELAQLAAPMRSILRLHEGDVLAPDALKKYFTAVYYTKGAELDQHKILLSISSTEECDFPFQTVASQFRMIDSHMLPIIVPFDDVAEENLELLRKLPEHMSVGKIAQKLQRYVVQVPERAFIQLLKVGAVAAINPEKFGGQFYELTSKEAWYSGQAGLDWNDPTFIRTSALIN
jgi:CRISPR-associated endonuclease/helicase Cas3